jgi:hypothetical protein
MYQHQHAAPPTDKLRNVSAPINALLEVLLAKDPGQRLQSPVQLRKAVLKVRQAIASESPLSPKELRLAGDQMADQSQKRKPKKRPLRWLAASVLGIEAGELTGFKDSGIRSRGGS